MIIQTIKAREVLDSRGNPTVEADVYLTNGVSEIMKLFFSYIEKNFFDFARHKRADITAKQKAPEGTIALPLTPLVK